MYNKLEIRNGRLVNDRPVGMTGIQEACMVKKDMNRSKKLDMYSEAVAVGMLKADMLKKTI
jgi:hypothetical protein